MGLLEGKSIKLRQAKSGFENGALESGINQLLTAGLSIDILCESTLEPGEA
jgi:hypothetical protein